MNVDLQAIDWGTQSARRQIKDPPDKNPGAWNIFHTWGGGLAMNSPLSNTPTPEPVRRQELVRLALRRGAREDPPGIPARAAGEAEGNRRASAEALLRGRPVHSGRAVLRADRLSQESLRHPGDTPAGALEHREEVGGERSGSRSRTGSRIPCSAAPGAVRRWFTLERRARGPAWRSRAARDSGHCHACLPDPPPAGGRAGDRGRHGVRLRAAASRARRPGRDHRR